MRWQSNSVEALRNEIPPCHVGLSHFCDMDITIAHSIYGTVLCSCWSGHDDILVNLIHCGGKGFIR